MGAGAGRGAPSGTGCAQLRRWHLGAELPLEAAPCQPENDAGSVRAATPGAEAQEVQEARESPAASWGAVGLRLHEWGAGRTQS